MWTISGPNPLTPTLSPSKGARGLSQPRPGPQIPSAPPLAKGGTGGFLGEKRRKSRRMSPLAGFLLLGTLAAGPCNTTTGGEGITGTIACGSGAATFTASYAVVGSVQSVKVTVTGSGISSPIEKNIDIKTLQATFNVPSGEGRLFSIEVKTDAATYTQNYTVCVPDNQPVSVGVAIARENRGPVITGMSPATGTWVAYSQPVTVSASDPDDDVLSYEWSTTRGSISGSGSSVTLNTSYCSICTATVSVTVRDGRGGNASASRTYNVF